MASLGGLAVIIVSGDADRLYVAFSLLVSTAVEGGPASGLITLNALPAITAGAVDEDLWQTVQQTDVKLYACGAGPFEVSSIPRFLKATETARLVVV